MLSKFQIQDELFGYYAALQRVQEYVAENLPHQISLGEAAAVAGMERKYFSTFFHRKVGVCFSHWLVWVRVTEAKRLMQYRDFSITEIALIVGFNDLRTFERGFKSCTDMTPREFRRSVQPQRDARQSTRFLPQSRE